MTTSQATTIETSVIQPRVKGPKPYVLPNGDVFHCVDPLEIPIAYREIFEQEVYFQHGIDLNDDDVIFDVGANMGMFAYHISRKHPSVKIFSFEPMPPTFAALEANRKNLGLKNVQSFNFGISNVASRAKFKFYPYSSGWSTMYPNESSDFKEIMVNNILAYEHMPWPLKILFKTPVLGRLLAKAVVKVQLSGKTFDCQLETVSEMIRRTGTKKIGLLKIDVERAEWNVLQGIDAQDWPKIRQVVIEAQSDHDKENPARILRLLKEKGFEVVEEKATYLLDDKGVSVNTNFFARRTS